MFLTALMKRQRPKYLKKGSGIESQTERRFSKQELIQILAFCTIPTHIWTLVNVFQDIPAWAQALSTWDLAGVVSYTLVAVLIETLVIFLLVTGISYFLPRRWVKDRSVSIAGYVIFEVSVLAVIAQTYIRRAMARALIPYAVIMAIAIVITVVLVVKSKRLHLWMLWIANPLSTLAAFYILLDFIALAVVGVRLL
jgi:hypothetical protein